jgi:hypothetical protein
MMRIVPEYGTPSVPFCRLVDRDIVETFNGNAFVAVAPVLSVTVN